MRKKLRTDGLVAAAYTAGGFFSSIVFFLCAKTTVDPVQQLMCFVLGAAGLIASIVLIVLTMLAEAKNLLPPDVVRAIKNVWSPYYTVADYDIFWNWVGWWFNPLNLIVSMIVGIGFYPHLWVLVIWWIVLYKITRS